MSEERLSELLGDIRFDEALAASREMVASGDILAFQREIIDGLHIIETKYTEGKLFIADLIVAGNLARDLFALAKDSPFMKQSAAVGTVVIGTILGDIHNIGKDLFADALRYRGITVVDLGVDVPPERFLASIAEHHPAVAAISACIDTSLAHTRELVGLIKKTAPEVKVIVGGSVVDERFTKLPGVDYLTRDYQSGIEFCVAQLGNADRGACTGG